MTKISEHPCNECGAPAIGVARDEKEIPSKDGVWSYWEPDGDRIFYCAKHPYKSKVTYLDPQPSPIYLARIKALKDAWARRVRDEN